MLKSPRLQRVSLSLLLELLCSFLLWTGGGLSRFEGLILCSTYIFYIGWLLKNREKIRQDEIDTVDEIKHNELNWTSAAYIAMVIIGLSFAIFAAPQSL